MISLICSTYNSAKWIDPYLTYVNNQFLDEFEIVFVDANSNDGSLDTIKNFEFRKGIHKKIIECKDKVPIYEAWNIGIKEAKYDYIMNYNTDDKIFPSSLLTLSIYAQMFPAIDVIYSNCYISTSEKHDNIVSVYNWADANNMDNLIKLGCCCGPFPMVKKQSAMDAGLFDPTYTISGDYEMWCRMNTKGYHFLKIEDLVGSYYHNPEGMSTDSTHRTEMIKQDTEIRRIYG